MYTVMYKIYISNLYTAMFFYHIYVCHIYLYMCLCLCFIYIYIYIYIFIFAYMYLCYMDILYIILHICVHIITNE